ncbi:serine phosphatase RsbU (regulator of sigma subunit) [Streptacidiphilus sp. MAP12-20]|uniref:PP2C family protein-serine/threonine phosphatase n=1 Tax=Streptacidiphilus sp. MAP12-20 TaxID=3156299 RepID=UPI003514B99F
MLAVPLTARGHLIGALTLARRAPTQPTATEPTATQPTNSDLPGDGFGDDDITLIEELAGRAALSVDNARRYMRSQGIALELQRALLAEPANPHPNLEIACRYLPSGTSSVVGGDWYESVRLPFGRTLLVIGDVMGHGVEAAVDMSTYRSMLRYVAAMDLPPHRILRQLDSLISENESARPATCLLALVDPSRNRVTFSSAGHLPPALVGPGQVTELVSLPSGPPLGTGVGGYQQLVRELLPGQVLLLYTDGLVERRHEDIDVSLDRLAAVPLPAGGELDDLIDAALHSSSPSDAEDDIALLAARVRPRST